MSKDERETSKAILKPTLKFFTSELTDLNIRRQQVNRSKGLARYFAKSQKNLRDITPLDTTLGVMSFSLYMLRFSANVGLLAQLILERGDNAPVQTEHRDLYYSLLNDSIWSLVNLAQFFWLSYSKSVGSGLQGMQLETLAQFIDLLVMVFRFQKDKEEYELKYQNANSMERARLAIEWQNKETNFLRALLTGLAIAVVFGIFSFSLAAVPLSPVISAILLISAVIRVLNDMERDQQLLNQLKLNGASAHQVFDEQQTMTRARLGDLNQIILSNVFLPIGLFLLLTTPIPVTIIACLSMLLIHTLVTHLINLEYSPEPGFANKFW